MAFEQYKQDYDGRYSTGCINFNSAGVALSTEPWFGTLAYDTVWMGNLQPYIKSKQVFLCPSQSPRKTDDTVATYSSYAYNMEYVGNCGNNPHVFKQPAADSQITFPAQTIVTLDSDQRYAIPVHVNNSNYLRVNDRHFDGVNVQFADGHVKWLKTDVALYKPADTSEANLAVDPDPKWLWNLK